MMQQNGISYVEMKITFQWQLMRVLASRISDNFTIYSTARSG